MFYLPHTFTAQDWRRMLRAMAALALVWMVLGATSSYAQSCFSVSEKQTKPVRLTVTYRTGDVQGETILETGSTTASYVGCSGFNNTTITWNLFLGALWPFTSSSTSSFNTTGANFKVFARCALAAGSGFGCKDATGTTTILGTTDNSDGIWMDTKITITGSDKIGNNCITVTNFTPDSTGGSAGSIHKITTRATSCVSITVKAESVWGQNAAFKPTNAVVLELSRVQSIGSSEIISFTTNNIAGSALPSFSMKTIGPSKLIPLFSTCALSLSNTFLNFGNVSVTTVSSAAVGATVVSRPFTVTINNCPAGFAAGKNKILQWTFSKPNADNKLLESELVVAGAAGLSAQIQADQRFSVSATPTLLLSNIVTSGEAYTTSGRTSDNQILNYQVNLIRNSDAVTAGGFNSTATVTLSYR